MVNNMQEDKEQQNGLTRAQNKLVDYSVAIYGEAATKKEAAYMARELVQCTLPHKNPGDVPAWSRKNGNLILGIQPGFNYATGKSYGYPYGTIPRLLLFWIITEAVRTKNRRLELGNSLAAFMRQLGLDSSRGGKRSDAKRLREQMERLFRSKFSFQKNHIGDNHSGASWLDMQVASKGEFWWSDKQPEQTTFWGSWIELGEDFYNAIVAAPVPVDMRALEALKKSPLALDLYAWLVYQAYRANKNQASRFETWEQLLSHLGGDYSEIGDFRRKVKAALNKIMLVYPHLRLGKRQGGIEILPESLPALQPKADIIESTASTLPPEPIPSCFYQLKPRTIERFKAQWSRLDPYTCQVAFDAWLADQPTDRTPKNYDAAFLGFAKKWVIGKL